MLIRSLALCNRLLSRQTSVLGFGLNADPLQISLPPLGPGAGGGTIQSASLEVIASLYFQAEMEQAAVIPLAELLTESRYSLQLTDRDAAELFEQFAEGMQQRWLNRQSRQQLFARTFGIGGDLLSEPGMAVNRNFEAEFARFCHALNQFQSDSRFSAPGASSSVQVEMTARQVLGNLARRQFGNTLSASQRIQGQLQAAINLLNHRSVTRLFQARDMWGLIRNVLEDGAPDLNRIVNRAQSGLRLLTWLAQHIADLNGGQMVNALGADHGVFLWAATWLQATGVGQQSGSPQPSASGGWPTADTGYSGTTPYPNPAPGFGGVFSATGLLRAMQDEADRELAA